jgi:DNA polymerase-3 subunit delta'
MSFNDIFGHEKQVKVLQKTLSQKRIGHAYLFSGIPSIGKKALAVEFARAYNCEKADSVQGSCGTCLSCRKIQQNKHPDYFFVKPEGQFIRINAIREIQNQMTFKPLEARCRVFIIDDADKMNEEAANALLKTLEEPSLANLIILITSRPYALAATVLSRCLHMRFNPLRQDIVAKLLTEKIGMEPQKAHLLAGLSGGSIGRALDLDDEEIISFRQETFDLLAATRKSEPFSMIKFASFLHKNKKKISLALDILISYFRDALAYKETKKSGILINQDKLSFIDAVAKRLSGEQILYNIELVERAARYLERNSNKLLTLETMAFKLNY